MRGVHFSRGLLFFGLSLAGIGTAWGDAPAAILPGEPAADPSKLKQLSPDDPLSWLVALPSSAFVESIYGGTDLDSNVRSAAAFAVLADYIEVQSGVDQELTGSALVETLPPLARPLWQEYAEHGYSKMLVGTARQLFRTPDFRADVLSRFVSPSQLAAYDTAWGYTQGAPLFEGFDKAGIIAALVLVFVVWRVQRRRASKRRGDTAPQARSRTSNATAR